MALESLEVEILDLLDATDIHKDLISIRSFEKRGEQLARKHDRDSLQEAVLCRVKAARGNELCSEFYFAGNSYDRASVTLYRLNRRPVLTNAVLLERSARCYGQVTRPERIQEAREDFCHTLIKAGQNYLWIGMTAKGIACAREGLNALRAIDDINKYGYIQNLLERFPAIITDNSQQ